MHLSTYPPTDLSCTYHLSISLPLYSPTDPPIHSSPIFLLINLPVPLPPYPPTHLPMHISTYLSILFHPPTHACLLTHPFYTASNYPLASVSSHMSICPSTYISIHLSISPIICPPFIPLSTHSSTYLTTYMFLNLSIHPETHSSICLPNNSCICPSSQLHPGTEADAISDFNA